VGPRDHSAGRYTGLHFCPPPGIDIDASSPARGHYLVHLNVRHTGCGPGIMNHKASTGREGNEEIVNRRRLCRIYNDVLPDPYARKTPMGLEVTKVDGDAVIKLSGRLDMNTSPDLRRAALTLYTKGKSKNLTIDFAQVSYIDTSGLATLVEILVTAQERCAQLTLSGLNEKVRYLLDVNGLTGFFRIAASVREKLHA